MNWKIHQGDCSEILKAMPTESIQTCITSPPYFGLRDYGTDGQIGLESSPKEYIENLVAVFAEVWRVLKADGTFWLNLGDSYVGTGGEYKNGSQGVNSVVGATSPESMPKIGRRQRIKNSGLKPKDLMLIPHRTAIALQDFGWYVRSDIIWSKTVCMPESVTDRPTQSHEHIFLLTKQPRYFYNADAIKEKKASSTLQDPRTNNNGERRERGFVGQVSNGGTNLGGRPQTARALEIARRSGLTDDHIAAIRAVGITDTGKAQITQNGRGKNIERIQKLADEAKQVLGGYYREFLFDDKRNKRTVWTVGPKPFKEAHFATFPEKLIEPCVLAGSREGDTILDPFSGAATTGVSAIRNGRNYIGIELNPEYIEISERRLKELSLPLFDL